MYDDDWTIEYDEEVEQHTVNTDRRITPQEAAQALNRCFKIGARKPHTLNRYTLGDIAETLSCSLRTVYNYIETYGKHPKQMSLRELVDFINEYSK